MTKAQGDMPASATEREVAARLNAAADWAGSLSWPLLAADVTGGAALAPSAPGWVKGRHGRSKDGTPVRLRPRVVWAALVSAAIAVAVVVPQISSHTNSASRTRTTSSTSPPSDKGGGSVSNAACTKTVNGVVVWNGEVFQLPVSPGRIISRSEAISIARGHVLDTTAQSVAPGAGVAKLSSWTEVSKLYPEPGENVPSSPTGDPWRPIWVVLLPTHPSDGVAATSPVWYMVAMDAAKGGRLVSMQVGRAWFSSLSDRDPGLKGCPGGSSARVPFGVLTRDEEAYAVHAQQPPGTEVVSKLTTVPALNHADPGLYGGCVRQNCSLDELVWPTIFVYEAPPGRTLSCLPGSVSVPPGYHPKQVKEYYTLSVPGNGEIGCGPIPAALANLKDLAPPAG